MRTLAGAELMAHMLSNWVGGVMDWVSQRVLPTIEAHTRIDEDQNGVKSLVVTTGDRELRFHFEEATQMVGEQARHIALDMKVRGGQLVTRVVGVFDAAKGAWISLAPDKTEPKRWQPTTRPIVDITKHNGD